MIIKLLKGCGRFVVATVLWLPASMAFCLKKRRIRSAQIPHLNYKLLFDRSVTDDCQHISYKPGEYEKTTADIVQQHLLLRSHGWRTTGRYIKFQNFVNNSFYLTIAVYAFLFPLTYFLSLGSGFPFMSYLTFGSLMALPLPACSIVLPNMYVALLNDKLFDEICNVIMIEFQNLGLKCFNLCNSQPYVELRYDQSIFQPLLDAGISELDRIRRDHRHLELGLLQQQRNHNHDDLSLGGEGNARASMVLQFESKRREANRQGDERSMGVPEAKRLLGDQQRDDQPDAAPLLAVAAAGRS